MAVDLRLLPIEHDDASFGLSHCVLDLNRDYALQDAIRTLSTEPLGIRRFSCLVSRCDKCGEQRYGQRYDDEYGEPLLTVRAGKLGSLDLDAIDIHQEAHKTRAAWAYIRALPPDTRIVLLWG